MYQTPMIMLGPVIPPHLIEHGDKIRDYGALYGHKRWALLYQTETRYRREVMPRLRRRGSNNLNIAIAAGGVTPFDVEKPWKHLVSLEENTW